MIIITKIKEINNSYFADLTLFHYDQKILILTRSNDDKYIDYLLISINIQFNLKN